MYEDRTKDILLAEMLAEIPAGLDKSEGSVIYTALSPSATKLAEAYAALADYYDSFSVDTATGAQQDRRYAEHNIIRKAAVPAVRAATFTGAVPAIGARFYAGELYWSVISSNIVQCETAGIIGNSVPEGTSLLPVEYVPNLSAASLSATSITGVDQESDDDYRQRYQEYVQDPPSDGNAAAFREMCLSVIGVGAVKIFGNWDGANTVKGVLLGIDKRAASQLVVDAVQEYVDPLDHQGEGEGAGQIGAFFTAAAAVEVAMNIAGEVVLNSGYTLQQAIDDISQALGSYLEEIAFENNIVRYAQITSRILDCHSVMDIQNLTVNGGAVNITIADTAVAVLGTVNISEHV